MGLKEDLDKIRKSGEKAFKDKDASASLDCMHKDVCVMRPGKEPMVGKDKAAAQLKEFMGKVDVSSFHMEKNVQETTAMGSDWAMERGQWKSSLGTGHFLTIWKKEGGKWQVIADCNNVFKKE